MPRKLYPKNHLEKQARIMAEEKAKKAGKKGCRGKSPGKA